MQQVQVVEHLDVVSYAFRRTRDAFVVLSRFHQQFEGVGRPLQRDYWSAHLN